MTSKITSDTSVDNVGKKINEDSDRIPSRRFYTPPLIIRLEDSNIESGTTTNLKEASSGVWITGS